MFGIATTLIVIGLAGLLYMMIRHPKELKSNTKIQLLIIVFIALAASGAVLLFLIGSNRITLPLH